MDILHKKLEPHTVCCTCTYQCCNHGWCEEEKGNHERVDYFLILKFPSLFYIFVVVIKLPVFLPRLLNKLSDKKYEICMGNGHVMYVCMQDRSDTEVDIINSAAIKREKS